MLDRVLTLVAALGVAAPGYWVGMILIIVVALNWELLPAGLYVPFGDDPVEWFKHLLLPAFALALAGIVEVTRQLRGALQRHHAAGLHPHRAGPRACAVAA